jgi:hypothetical protein
VVTFSMNRVKRCAAASNAVRQNHFIPATPHYSLVPVLNYRAAESFIPSSQ